MTPTEPNPTTIPATPTPTRPESTPTTLPTPTTANSKDPDGDAVSDVDR